MSLVVFFFLFHRTFTHEKPNTHMWSEYILISPPYKHWTKLWLSLPIVLFEGQIRAIFLKTLFVSFCLNVSSLLQLLVFWTIQTEIVILLSALKIQRLPVCSCSCALMMSWDVPLLEGDSDLLVALETSLLQINTRLETSWEWPENSCVNLNPDNYL